MDEQESAEIERGLGESHQVLPQEVERVQALLEARLLGGEPVSTKIGRFVVLDRIGAGAMGAVYSAYDGQLDRRVALKLLHPRRDASELERRLGREAQAMARLSHPNVVTIHEVGEHCGVLYLAMELVDGLTLRAWLRAEPRTWREVIAVFEQAGRGLAAAHEAGLVHRDFKPDNVLIDRAGRVRVADFGLAHTGSGIAEDEATTTETEIDGDERLTRSGAILGTPAYMSPEQARGEDAGAADDQFSYCVALYEGLFGVRPFAGDRLADLVANIRARVFVEPPRRRDVPSRLTAVIRRGLASEREQRWPSMTALVEALLRDPTRQRRRWLAAGSAAALGIAGIATWSWLEHRSLQRCESSGDAIAQSWNEAAREQAHDAFVATGLGFAEDAWLRAEPIVRGAVDRATAARVESCNATLIRKEVDASEATAMSDCLDQREQQLLGLIAAWSEADAATVERAVPAAGGLPDASVCLDRGWLRDRPAPPRDEAEHDRVRAVRSQLASATAQSLAGHIPRAADLTRVAIADADEIGYEPLRAEALRQIGQLESELGDFEAALRDLAAAYTAATRSRHDDEAVEAAVRLVFASTLAGDLRGADRWASIADATLERADRRESPTAVALLGFRASLALRRSEVDEADRLFREGEALIVRIDPEPRSVVRAMLLENWGLAASARGKYDEAEAHHSEAHAIKLERLGPDHPDVGGSLNNLGLLQMARGDFAGAAKLFERSIAILERAYGPNPPRAAAVIDNLGLDNARMGNHEVSLGLHRRALSIREEALGKDHLELAGSLSNMALPEMALGNFDAAEEHFVRALAIVERHDLGESGQAAVIIDNLGLVAVERGDLPLALERHTRSLEIRERLFGPDNPEVAGSLSNLAEAELASGRLELAFEHASRAVEILRKALGPEHVFVSYGLLTLGTVRIEQGRRAEALPFLEQALELRVRGQMSVTDVALARALLARALVGSDDARAKELRALARSECAPTPELPTCRDIATWIAG